VLHEVLVARQESGSGCPVHAVLAQRESTCPLSGHADAFDPFDEAYQLDPVAALRWSRAQQPVFYAPKLGYWVVTRYDDVKAVFRDSIAFSPAIALEKITPGTAESAAVLARYGYAMNRTLVNEDEPAHMERRRALLHSFLPEQLAHHEPMVRRLTREYVDRFIERGEVDLVDEMLWEVPLTVALHFLGVPEEDMDTLRGYSIAHTVNTWGRPTPDQQVAVAEAVGRFWAYAGKVLDKMRADPSGHGWMQYAIRKQKELPDVVTDSYLHSMMMAGIVAAHETTANATGNALRLLLEDRPLWNAICADPGLIPNAAEECLRFSGSIIAWRRIAMADTQIGGVSIPQGSKVLVVMTSANHDERHFENPDVVDLYRDNTTDHLSFGYGSHQCMGKNLARMEMRVFLEELTRRLPHMELVPGQSFAYLPNVSFRGPEHLLVRWDPARNPERADPSLRDGVRRFEIGAPSTKALAREVRIAAAVRETDEVVSLTLEDPNGRALPPWTAGAHIDLIAGPFSRKYSLCGSTDTPSRYEVAVRRDASGRGGSAHIHDVLQPGMTVHVRSPRNHFRLDEGGDGAVLLAGGIGITPIIAMADRLKALGREYTLHYCGRSRSRMAFVTRLERDHGHCLHLYPKEAGKRLDLSELIANAASNAPIYACGPTRLLSALTELLADQPHRLHVEHFTPAGAPLDASHENPFEVELADSGLTVPVAANETLLHALRAVGIDVPSDCGEGLCGTCEVPVLSGEVDHRDIVLTEGERREGRRMMACCSRARSGKLVLAL
jgi:cytochrome P450/ferredoxin-NADP reductase